MTSDIQAVCERLEAACQTIERGNPMTAVDSIRGTIRWMADTESIIWVPIEYEADGATIKEDGRPDEGELVIVTIKSEHGRRYLDIDKCIGGKWSGHREPGENRKDHGHGILDDTVQPGHHEAVARLRSGRWKKCEVRRQVGASG